MPQKTNLCTTHILQDSSSIKAFLGAVSETKIMGFSRIYTGDNWIDMFGGADQRLEPPDIMIEDGEHNCYIVRYMQDGIEDLEQLRRCYQSAADRYYFAQAESSADFPELYIIFICNYDYYGLGHAMYYMDDIYDGYEIDNGRHMVVLNSRYRVANAAPQIMALLDSIHSAIGNVHFPQPQ